MGTGTIIVSSPKKEMADKIKAVLMQGQFLSVEICLSGNETIRKANTLMPVLTIINYELSDTTGLEVAKVLYDKKTCPCILLTNQMQKNYAEGIISYPHLICLNKPFNASILLNSVEIAIKSQKGIKKLEKQIHTLKLDIQSRKFIEQAKGLLMEKMGMTEDEAFKKIQKQSMNTGITMKDVSKIIIETMR